MHPNTSYYLSPCEKPAMSSLVLLLLFLSLSIYSCDGRHLGTLVKDSSRLSHHPDKDAAKVTDNEMSVYDKPTHSSADGDKLRGQGPENGSIIGGGATNGGSNASEATSRNVEGMRGTTSGSVGTQSLAKVPWRVPRPVAHREHPGFNLDYAGPRTHPPSHN